MSDRPACDELAVDVVADLEVLGQVAREVLAGREPVRLPGVDDADAEAAGMDLLAHYESASLLSSSVSSRTFSRPARPRARLGLCSARARRLRSASGFRLGSASASGSGSAFAAGLRRRFGLGLGLLFGARSRLGRLRLGCRLLGRRSSTAVSAAARRSGAAALRLRLRLVGSAGASSAGRGRRSGRGLISPGSAGPSTIVMWQVRLRIRFTRPRARGAPALERRALVGVGVDDDQLVGVVAVVVLGVGDRRLQHLAGIAGDGARLERQDRWRLRPRTCRGCARAPAAPCAPTCARSGPVP